MSQGRVALVTGGASGIGLAAVRRLHAADWRVLVVDLNEQSLRTAVDALGAGPSIASVTADVTQERDVHAAVEHAVDMFGRLDCVINNAGVGGAFGPVSQIDVAHWDYTFAVLVRGVFLGIKHGTAAISATAGAGSIVNTASAAGLLGGYGPLAYSAAKAAVVHMTKLTAVELAPQRIRVNCVCPGVIRTPLTETGTKDVERAIAGIQPWPEPGTAQDVAEAIYFLASDAHFVTGESLLVDGGLSASGVRLDDAIGGNPALRGLAGVNRGSTGARHEVRSVTHDR